MNHPSKQSRPIALKFSLRDLLLVVTAVSIFMALSTLLPRDTLQFVIRLADLGFIAALVAAAMTWTGRWRIACVAVLVSISFTAFGSPAFRPLFRDFIPPFRGLGNIHDIAVFSSRWVEALLSGGVAYAVAGWLVSKK